ncbi:lipase family protein [Geobacter sp. SVR]|uniref:lipase family protein n=1 Tax=Geobacter sp. SVR TaxID=2495594 RepID=UPI00143F00BB|nr:lipase family protein [Geobacter sp. SVR]BCS52540.1 hypothetical protein GSVR_08480 [Geobacter sp. SVR]GCF84023.1 hypothetical protein GSbR_06230 [Geobacter sp. SVR]
MLRFATMPAALRTAVVAVALLVAGCNSDSSTQPSGSSGVKIEPAALAASITAGLQQSLARELAGWDWSSFVGSFGSLLTGARFSLQMQKVTYQSTGANGVARTLTGLLILPVAADGSKPAVPLLMFQHGSETFRQFSPSQFLAHLDRPTDYPEVMVAAAIATNGYAVAMADYEGMGDNTDPQPYVVGTALAVQVIDMLKASRDIMAGSDSSSTWNSQLFLLGYSEGGYVTMTTTRELQQNHAGEFTVTASAPLAGPYDLSGVMRGVILADTPYKNPFFLPFVLTGYTYAYAGRTALFSPPQSMKPPFDTTLPPLFTGTTTSDVINEAMGMSYNPVHLIVPKSILTQQFIDQLSNTASTVVGILAENDAYRGWAPNTPMRLIHHPDDELVPFANSQVAFNAFSTAGAKKFVSLVPETVAIGVSDDPVHTVHFGAAFPALSDGWKFLDGFKK